MNNIFCGNLHTQKPIKTHHLETVINKISNINKFMEVKSYVFLHVLHANCRLFFISVVIFHNFYVCLVAEIYGFCP